jgi:membrane protein YdbS with pleckstrin-like domain
MTAANPINAQLKTFARFNDAMEICDLLNRETGNEYTVMTDNNLGFTVSRLKEGRPNEQNPAKATEHDGVVYRPAFRGFIPHYLEIAIGLLLIANPYTLLGWIFTLLNIQIIPEWFKLHDWGEAFRFGGCFLLLYGLRFIYSRYATRLWLDNDGASMKKGIIAQDHVQIRFPDIKTIGVHQSILERLLGIGTLHLDSAGTNGEVDIVFNNLVNPDYLRRRIMSFIALSTQQRR